MERPVLSAASAHQTGLAETFVSSEAYASGVTWAAVIAGAFITAALWLILLALGAGLGFSSVSPWSNAGASASAISKIAIVWLIIVQIIACATGGYLAGRLRTKWATVHTDEVYFRDTAHGFLVWAVAFVATAAFLASAAVFMAGRAPSLPATAVAGAADLPAGSQDLYPNAYFIDTLFRSSNPGADRNDAQVRAEAARILTHALVQKNLPAADQTYLAALVAAKTRLSQSDS